jgi:hypothetical protein
MLSKASSSSSTSAAFALIGSRDPRITHPQRVVKDRLEMRVEVQATISRPPGASSSAAGAVLDGTASVGGLSAQVIFRNDQPGLHPYPRSGCADAELIEPRRELSLRRSGALGPARGDPFVVLRWFDAHFAPLSGEIVLGRMSEAPFQSSVATQLPLSVSVSICALECDRDRGPTIELSGESTLERGILATLGFRDERRPPNATRTEDSAFVVLPPGIPLGLIEQVACSEIGGEPTISLKFRSGSGVPISPEYVVGRCVTVPS